MSLRLGFIPQTLVFVLACAAALTLFPSFSSAQKTAKKLSKQDVVELLMTGVSSSDISRQARDEGISFQVTPDVEREIRGAGGTDALISTLKSLAPRAPAAPSLPSTPPTVAPAVLMIESTPGQCQVYVDDEPMGSTSQEGRLKLTKISPGSHTVRISLNGYQDHEQSVTLTAGAVTNVSAPLQRVTATNIAPPSVTPAPQNPTAPETPAAGSMAPGYLGVLPMEPQPAGARGVVISGAAPGGPGEQIGLKPNDTILAINGKAVTNPRILMRYLRSQQPGDVVKITWYDGSNTVTREARLVSYPAQNPQVQQQQPELPQQPQLPQQPPQTQIQVPTVNPAPNAGVQTFLVGHDHNMNGQNYCVGLMTVGNGMVIYKGLKGNGPLHNFDIPTGTIRQAQRNKIYLSLIGGFHITLKRGTNLNFVLYNQQGQPQPPDEILTAIDNAMGR